MAIVTFALVLLLALGLGLYSRVGVKSTEDFMVGGRSFGPLLLFILVVGEVYSIGTVIGFPGGIYAQGAEFGMWFMGYILLCYPIGYFLLPLLWRAGRRYNAITLPDVFRGHFRSRALELTAAAVGVIFLIPWAQLQLTGLTVALDGLGLGLSPLATVLIGVGLSLAFTLLAGIRAPAYVSFVKDFALIFAIIVVAVFVLARDPRALTTITQAPGITEHVTIAPGASMTKTLSTLLFQAVGFHMFPFMVQAAMTSASGRAVKKTQIMKEQRLSRTGEAPGEEEGATCTNYDHVLSLQAEQSNTHPILDSLDPAPGRITYFNSLSTPTHKEGPHC